MGSRKDRKPEDLVLDPDVLRPGPVCEFGAARAVEAQGGTAVLPWRDAHRLAEAQELTVVSHARDLPSHSFPQVAVHLQKSRAATFDDLRHAWRLLRPDGQLLFVGPNTLGIVSAVKRLAEQLDQTPIVVSNRARARAVRFKKDDGPGPQAEATGSFTARVEPIAGDPIEVELATRPGVFSAGKLDAGSELLLAALPEFIGHKPPKRIADLGCGTGVLGLSAALLYPEAEVLLADADARAVECATANAEALELSDRCRVAWWDAREAAVDKRFDLALVNPPFHHRGAEVDLGPALALFDSLGTWLKIGGRALVVANRSLPYENPLAELGTVETIRSARGYKLLSLSVKRRTRSSGARGRSSPGSRSSGNRRSPTRSR